MSLTNQIERFIEKSWKETDNFFYLSFRGKLTLSLERLEKLESIRRIVMKIIHQSRTDG